MNHSSVIVFFSWLLTSLWHCCEGNSNKLGEAKQWLHGSCFATVQAGPVSISTSQRYHFSFFFPQVVVTSYRSAAMWGFSLVKQWSCFSNDKER